MSIIVGDGVSVIIPANLALQYIANTTTLFCMYTSLLLVITFLIDMYSPYTAVKGPIEFPWLNPPLLTEPDAVTPTGARIIPVETLPVGTV